MDRKSLMISVLGGMFGVVIVLVFSFVIAERFDLTPPAKPGDTLAGTGADGSGRHNLASGNGNRGLAVSEPQAYYAKLGVVQANGAQLGQGFVASLLGQGLLTGTVSTVDGVVKSIVEQAPALPGQIQDSSAGALLPAQTHPVLGSQSAKAAAAARQVLSQEGARLPTILANLMKTKTQNQKVMDLLDR